ncbi:MAG: ABC transporter ATP-binding protein/permease [Roseburia sp.]|nr:ABC transporter ATP-binding protein/permease [Anaeroplasma bactoclasticum]MCM1196152.1 ABC transporter ATP-binding protein/permease [Roseburia sp.]MCM1557642.1 ABC transporter ATP-binding protein/permease [Anaeroplasma bactoclasticum]
MFKRFIQYYKPYKKIFILDMLAALFISLIGLLYPILTNRILKVYIPQNNIKLIVILGAILLISYFVRMLLRYFVQYYGHVMGVKMQADMRSQMFRHLQKLSFSYYDEHETGKIMSRMTNDLMNVSELAHHGPENIFICGTTVILSFIYLMTINWLLTLIIFTCVPLLIFISLFMRKRMNRAFMETRKSVAEINGALESSITGVRVTKAFNNSDEEVRKFEIGNKSFVDARSKAYKAMGQFGSSTAFVTDLFNLVILIIGAIFIYYSFGVDYVVLTTFMVSISIFINPLTTLINFVEQYQEGVTGFKRFVEIIDTEEETEALDTLDVDFLKGAISFTHVYFDYETTKGVLKDVSFEIGKGKKIAFVGPSGGGKTTICHLIPHFYPVTSGEISIDGYNINLLKLEVLRKNIGIVQQDVFLFTGTILDNIRYGRLDASDEEVYEAAKKANIHDYILTLEDGYNTQIGERGIKLSGGQKQRLSIARVFLKNPPILILDEATSALDNVTESYIQASLEELTKGRTTIIVAHRLSTVKNADYIYVIANGVIEESGSHEELLKAKGRYANLYYQQFKETELLVNQ